jgi:lipid-binding SYLF domain-containing protein
MGSFNYRVWTVAAIIGCAVGCTTEPDSAGDRASLQDDAAATMKRLNVEDTGLQGFLDHSYGYAIFPTVGKGGLIAGGAYGHGLVYEKGQFVGYADISQATIGLQAGGQSFSEVVAFEYKDALTNFESGRFAFAANASAVALKSGAASSAKYDEGIAVFVDPIGGLMVEASVGGQSFSYQPK